MSFCILLRKSLFYFNYRFHVPVVMYVLLSLHNLLLVVNSSVNFIIYCCVGKRFRQELKLMLTPYCNFVCRCVCNDQKDQADAEDPVPCQFWSLLNETWNICIPPLHVIGKFQKYIPILMSILSSIVVWGKRFCQELKLMLTPYCKFVCRCVCNYHKDQADAEEPVPCQFWSPLLTWNMKYMYSFSSLYL